MKKLFTLFVAVLIVSATTTLQAQSQRFVLSEEFTQASCGPCASQNPGFNALLQENEDKIIAIKYQTSWPGVDPMNADNPTEVQTRVDYYGVDGVPMATVDGEFIVDDCNAYEGSPACLSQNDIDAAYAVPASFDITVDASVTNGVLNVSADVTCTQDYAGSNPKLFIVLIEKVIDWGTAPGSNGEVVFYNVMKKFLPGTGGIEMPASWTSGESVTYDEMLNVSEVNIYEMGELAVVAFIQETGSKEVLQTGVALTVDITVDYNNSVALAEIDNLPQSVCSGMQSIDPAVKIQNMGNNDLTSAVINYNMNGGADSIFNWTGSLATLAKESVQLPAYDFVSTGSDVLNVNVSMPNGVVDDDDTPDNELSESLDAAPVASIYLTVDLNTDCWPEENTWEITNSDGNIVASGGPYPGQDDMNIIELIELPASDCYEFKFMDEFGDGLHGSQWSGCSVDGSLEVYDDYGNVVFSYDGSYDAGEIITNFEGSTAVGIEELSNISQFKIYPNPAGNVAYLEMDITGSNPVRLEVIDLLGKMVYSEVMGTLSAGQHRFEINTATIGNGMYLFNIYIGNQVVTERMSIHK